MDEWKKSCTFSIGEREREERDKRENNLFFIGWINMNKGKIETIFFLSLFSLTKVYFILSQNNPRCVHSSIKIDEILINY